MESTDDSRTKSNRLRRKRKAYEPVKEESKKEHRPCAKSGCSEAMPRCCLQASDNCCRDGYTSRWYHMSLGEHFCNECFDYFYRPQKEGFPRYDSWYHQWYGASKIRPYIKRFVADEVMPFWLQCSSPKCGKWREVHSSTDLTHDYIAHFDCSVLYGSLQKDPCAIEEESCVSDVSSPYWFKQLSEFPLLKNSPAAPYLKQFCEEGIGLNPISNIPAYDVPKWIEPFSEALNGESSIWPQPNSVEKEEEVHVPIALESSASVLGLRNLVVSVWNMFPEKWITKQNISPYIVCRGLARVYLLNAVDSIVHYLTRKAIINFGIVSPTVDIPVLQETKENVIVIGGGLAGLSAAKHLHNLGIETVVLEARSAVGGRIQCGTELPTVMTISGLVNNPLTVLCHQVKFDIQEVPDNLLFITDGGKIIPAETIERMVHQFSGMMHGALEWSAQQNSDANWFETITSHQKDFHNVANFTAEEDQIFEFLLKLTDIKHHTNCRSLTLKNYEFAKKLGADGLVVQGLPSLVQKLASGLDIVLNTTVQTVKLLEDCVEVLADNNSFRASRVVVAVPLPILRDNHIVFEPSLPEYKTAALKALGIVTYEQVLLQFPKRFWKSVLKENGLKFGIISSSDTPFQYFVDASGNDDTKQPTLVTYITESNKDAVKDLDKNGIMDLCYTTLKSVFKQLKITVPKPTYCEVTQWSQDKHFKICGTYVPVSASYELYDQLAENINGRIFFAGEATFRKNPNSLSGAFLSGLREAANVVDFVSQRVS